MNNSRIGGIVFLLLSGLYGYYAGDIPLDFWSEQEAFNARSMPRLISAAGILTSLILILGPSPQTDWSRWQQLNWRPAIFLLVWMSLYGLVLEFLGFALATVLFLAGAFVMLGERRPLPVLAVSIPLVLGFWLLMDQLGIYLSPGELFSLVGSR